MPDETAGLAVLVERVAAPLRDQVLDGLRQAIVEQRLPPGRRLIERELVEQIGVSRTTIREVLRQLTAEGLITTIPQKGAVVAAPSPQEAADLYEVRAALEGLAARMFVERASEAQVGALRAAFADLTRVTHDGGEIRSMLQAKDRFYDVLLDGAGNGAIRGILSQLQARVSVLRATSLSQPGRPARSVAEIATLVAAIEARDAEAAVAAAARHLEQAASTGLSALRA